MAISKAEKARRRLLDARSLKLQGRYGEAFNQYEKIAAMYIPSRKKVSEDATVIFDRKRGK